MGIDLGQHRNDEAAVANGAGFMSASTMIVALNAQLLRRLNYPSGFPMLHRLPTLIHIPGTQGRMAQGCAIFRSRFVCMICPTAIPTPTPPTTHSCQNLTRKRHSGWRTCLSVVLQDCIFSSTEQS